MATQHSQNQDYITYTKQLKVIGLKEVQLITEFSKEANSKENKMNYKTILNTIAVSALGYLPFTNTANASIQETQQPNTANTEYNQLIQEVVI